MRDGFVKVAAVSCEIRVCDTEFNKDMICEKAIEAANEGAKIIVFPELCVTGYSCEDLFFQRTLIESARNAVLEIADNLKSVEALVIIGAPIEVEDKLYNCGIVINKGIILAVIPKVRIPNHAEFRYFNKGNEYPKKIEIEPGEKVPFGSNIILECDGYKELKVSVEIGEDAFAPVPMGMSHALNGATIIAHLSANAKIIGREEYEKTLIKGQSGRLIMGYVHANVGEGESTTDLVFGGQNLICENGCVLSEGNSLDCAITYGDIDVKKIVSERIKSSVFEGYCYTDEYSKIIFEVDICETNLSRKFEKFPFVPSDLSEMEKRCEEILTIQSMGLKKRLKHTNCKTAVVGISGGLDSTLALLVTVKAFDMLKIPRENIITVTMPCFGTTDRTYNNAVELTKALGTSLKEIDIKNAVRCHFNDISQDENNHDVTYENAQARERTQVLMDVANMHGGMVIGTGDLSELALGWATYNGDHMSMYGVNASVPKTLVRYLVDYYGKTCGDEKLTEILLDVLNTPVSPELLPPKEGEIAQKTEDIVGPYELHDFFMYYVLRYGFEPAKIYRIATCAFAGEYEENVILKWLQTFYKRFFSQQFKRSCLPDGPKVGTVSVSPRGDLHMPSDASANIWLKDVMSL